jgi:hypothetical protein
MYVMQEVSMAGQVWGGIEAGLLSLSIIAAAVFLGLLLQPLLCRSPPRVTTAPRKIMACLWLVALLSS